MASTPLPGGSRHVGRVVDPAVRDDGEIEPAVELEGQAPTDLADPAADPTHEAAGLPRGGRARDLLLERAQARREALAAEDAGAPLGDLDEIGRLESEPLLEPELGAPLSRAPSAPLLGVPRGRLSPNWIAVFGTLLGIATVASLTALGMNFEARAPSASIPAPSAKAPDVATPDAAPAPPPAKAKKARAKLPGPYRVADSKGDSALRLIEGKVGSEPFLKALEKAGVPTRETYRVLAAMKGVRDFDRCKASDRFAVLLERGSSKLKAFEYAVSPEEVYQAREGADGFLKGAKLNLEVARNDVVGALVYDGQSFDGSAELAGFDRGLARAVSKALDGHMALDEIEAGSRVRVLAQEVTVLGEFARYSGIEALEVLGPGSDKPFRLYYFAAGAEKGYFDNDGRSPYEGGWRKPIKDAPMTSPFNMKRLHPILKRVQPHLGIDFGSPTGTPVGAASYGKVILASYVGPTGNLVRIEHANGIETGYAHLSRYAEGLKVGDKVKRLQIIGYVGSTGRSTGPHLHFSARRNGEFFDPATLNLDAMRVVSKENRAAFAEVKARLDGRLDAIALPPPPAAKPEAPAAKPEASSQSAPAPAAPAADPAAEDDESETETAAPSPSAKPAPARKPGSSVYLSDKELLQLQGATDEGEIAE